MKTHQSLRNVNIPLLLKIRDRIAARPRQFQMAKYFNEVCTTGEAPSHCGTAACIAGWAVVLGGKAKNPKLAHAIYGEGFKRVNLDASSLLGLASNQAWTMFCTAWWPPQFYAAYHTAKTPAAAAKVAVARINHFIKTGE